VEDSALMVDLGPYGCPKSPRKPDPPRKWDRTGSRGGWDSADRSSEPVSPIGQSSHYHSGRSSLQRVRDPWPVRM